MQLGRCHGRVTPVVFNLYEITEAGKELMRDSHCILLPIISCHSSQVATKQTKNVTMFRRSKGTHLLPKLSKLLSSCENWFEITQPDDYYYPGQFKSDYPKRLGFVPDITKLSFYVKEDEHFLFNDIQIGKGKLRSVRKLQISIEGKEESLNYRIAPCGGVKMCSAVGCSYVTSTREHRHCSSHPDSLLVSSGECPVEFVYVWPVDDTDKRRWLSGIVRQGDMTQTNLHNHPFHQSTKIPSKVIHDIQHALHTDPQLTTHDIITGN